MEISRALGTNPSGILKERYVVASSRQMKLRQSAGKAAVGVQRDGVSGCTLSATSEAAIGSGKLEKSREPITPGIEQGECHTKSKRMTMTAYPYTSGC